MPLHHKSDPQSLSPSSVIRGLGLTLNMTYPRWSIRKEVFLSRTGKKLMKNVSGRKSRGNGKEPGKIKSLVCFWPWFTNLATDHCKIAIVLDSMQSLKCRDCGSLDIDHQFRKFFRCLVCKKCQNEKPETYSLLTKTECKEASSLVFWLIIADGDVGLSPDRPRDARRGSIATFIESQPAQVDIRKYVVVLTISSRGVRLEEVGVSWRTRRRVWATTVREEKEKE